MLPDYRTRYAAAKDTEVELVSCPYFDTSLYDLTQEHALDLAALDSFVVVICMEGRGTLVDDRGETVAVHQGETVLVPASTQGRTRREHEAAHELHTLTRMRDAKTCRNDPAVFFRPEHLPFCVLFATFE